ICGRSMPEDFQLAVTVTFGRVHNEPEAILHEEYQPPMAHRRVKPHIAVMRGFQEIERFAREPPLHRDLREAPPGKWLNRFGLVLSFHYQSVVGAGAAELIAPFPRTRVGKRAGITGPFHTVRRHTNAQGVRVAVPAARRTERAGIHSQTEALT